MSLAKLLEARGQRRVAEGILAPIYSEFDEGFETADLRSAKDWLEKTN